MNWLRTLIRGFVDSPRSNVEMIDEARAAIQDPGVIALLARGERVAAVRLLREKVRGLGLRDAVALIDQEMDRR